MQNNMAEFLLSKYGKSILKQNISKWTDLREVKAHRFNIPTTIKKKIANLDEQEGQKVIRDLKKLIFENFPERWRLFFITGQRYALESDLITSYSSIFDGSVFESIHAYGIVSYAKGFFKNTESLGITIDVEVHGLDDHGNVNPYLKLSNSQIKSLHIGCSS
jgi:hypothetical protein